MEKRELLIEILLQTVSALNLFSSPDSNIKEDVLASRGNKNDRTVMKMSNK